MSKKYNLRIIGIAKTKTIPIFLGETTSHVLPRDNWGSDNWGFYETRLEISKDETLNRNLLQEIGDIDTIILCGDQMELEREVKVGKNNLNLSFDEEEIKREDRKLVVKRGVKIKNNNSSLNFSSSHSTTAAKDNNNNLWTSGETNYNHGAEAENSSNETPNLWEPEENAELETNSTTNSTLNKSVESEKAAKVRETIASVGLEGENIIGGNDIAKMKEVIQKLESYKNGSAEEKAEFNTWDGNRILDELKGKATALESAANQQSGSSQPDQPVQPSQAEIFASIQQENETKKNDVDNKLNQAESENATKEEVAEAVKGSASNFGDENFQEQNKRQEALEEKLAVEDFELYLKTMIDKVSLCLEENNLEETDLELTNELRNQWTRLNRKVIQDKNQVKEIVQQMQEQIIRKANEKELNNIQKRVKQNNEKRLSESKRKKLVADIMRYIEKTKSNTYVKANTSEGERLLRELNNTTKQEVSKPKEFPWVPVSLGIGAAVILISAVFVIRSRKLKSKQG